MGERAIRNDAQNAGRRLIAETHPDSAGVRRQRSTLMIGNLVAGSVAIAIWVGVRDGLPPLPGMADPLARLTFALQCSCVAILLCFITGIEAVAHERLFSPAINPLAGRNRRE